MRIDLSQCGFHNCRYQFDGNCTSKSKYSKCEYRYLNEQPERKKGEWIAYGDIPKTCSCCHEDWDKYVEWDVWYHDELPNFCPNCGADMRTKAESEDKE